MTKHDDHHGLAHDLQVLQKSALKRRDVIRFAASTGLLALAGCSDDTASSPIDDKSSGSTAAGTGSGGTKTAANGGSGAAGSKASTSGAAGKAAAGSGGKAAEGGQGGTAAGSGGAMGASSGDSCAAIPEEIVGPYPADGSNGASGGPPPDFDPSMLPKGGFPGDGGMPPGLPPGTMIPPPSDSDGGTEDLLNVLRTEGIVRSDIRSGIAGAGKVAEGVPMTLTLKLVNSEDGCSPLAGAAVYIWHCDRAGDYSLYSEALKDENYLRGVQQADKSGQLTFKTIVPGCYAGRWPHFHLEVYKNLANATDYKSKHITTQLALPKDVCDAAYAEDGYEKSAKNISSLSLDGDLIFSDGYEAELPKVTGTVAKGFAASLTVGLKPL